MANENVRNCQIYQKTNFSTLIDEINDTVEKLVEYLKTTTFAGEEKIKTYFRRNNRVYYMLGLDEKYRVAQKRCYSNNLQFIQPQSDFASLLLELQQEVTDPPGFTFADKEFFIVLTKNRRTSKLYYHLRNQILPTYWGTSLLSDNSNSVDIEGTYDDQLCYSIKIPSTLRANSVFTIEGSDCAVKKALTLCEGPVPPSLDSNILLRENFRTTFEHYRQKTSPVKTAFQQLLVSDKCAGSEVLDVSTIKINSRLSKINANLDSPSKIEKLLPLLPFFRQDLDEFLQIAENLPFSALSVDFLKFCLCDTPLIPTQTTSVSPRPAQSQTLVTNPATANPVTQPIPSTLVFEGGRGVTQGLTSKNYQMATNERQTPPSYAQNYRGYMNNLNPQNMKHFLEFLLQQRYNQQQLSSDYNVQNRQNSLHNVQNRQNLPHKLENQQNAFQNLQNGLQNDFNFQNTRNFGHSSQNSRNTEKSLNQNMRYPNNYFMQNGNDLGQIQDQSHSTQNHLIQNNSNFQNSSHISNKTLANSSVNNTLDLIKFPTTNVGGSHGGLLQQNSGITGNKGYEQNYEDSHLMNKKSLQNWLKSHQFPYQLYQFNLGVASRNPTINENLMHETKSRSTENPLKESTENITTKSDQKSPQKTNSTGNDSNASNSKTDATKKIENPKNSTIFNFDIRTSEGKSLISLIITIIGTSAALLALLISIGILVMSYFKRKRNKSMPKRYRSSQSINLLELKSLQKEPKVSFPSSSSSSEDDYENQVEVATPLVLRNIPVEITPIRNVKKGKKKGKKGNRVTKVKQVKFEETPCLEMVSPTVSRSKASLNSEDSTIFLYH